MLSGGILKYAVDQIVLYGSSTDPAVQRMADEAIDAFRPGSEYQPMQVLGLIGSYCTIASWSAASR